MSTPKTCELCGVALELRRAPGRKHEYRSGLELPVPDDFPIPTCPQCDEVYLSEDGYRALEEAQKPAFIEWQKSHVAELVQVIRDAHPNVRLRDIERACDVTGTYLSHVLGGRNPASQMLINLLEAFALYPDEFARQLSGADWKSARASSHVATPAGSATIIPLASRVKKSPYRRSVAMPDAGTESPMSAGGGWSC